MEIILQIRDVKNKIILFAGRLNSIGTNEIFYLTMRTYAIPVLMILTLSACSKREDEKRDRYKKGFELSNTMMGSISLAKAEKRNIEGIYRFYGKIITAENRSIDIYPLAAGNGISVNVEFEDYVKKGKVPAAVRGQLQKVQDLLQQASTLYNVRTGSIYNVVVPISRNIFLKNINKDLQRKNDWGEKNVDVVNTSNVWGIMNVNQSDIDKISFGMKAWVSTLSYPDKVFDVKMDKIFNGIDPQPNPIEDRGGLNNTGLLIPERGATIKVFNLENYSMLTVPSKAIIFDNNKSFVVVYKSRTNVKIREIKVLKQVGDIAYIIQGLTEGEEVITYNQLIIYRSLNS